MSVTAFPVLARILDDRGLAKTSFGDMAMACAAVADVSAWVVLALVVTLARGGLPDMARTLGQTILRIMLYLLAMFAVVRPAIRVLWARQRARVKDRSAALGQDQITVLLIVVLVSAVATEWLGIHALFGAFVAGAVMPVDDELRTSLRAGFEDLL